MAKWGSADFRELQALREKLKKLESERVRKFCEDCSKALAARLLALVIPRTPVGVYSPESGRKGGTLRRGWTAGKRSAGTSYAESLPVYKNGDAYTIVVSNPVQYASYVEFGHRQTPGRYVPELGKTLKASWVNGQYMLTLSEEALEKAAPGLLQMKLDAFLQEVFGNG